jgi:hypothetical protein
MGIFGGRQIKSVVYLDHILTFFFGIASILLFYGILKKS